jgi:hypothetical protein
VEAEFADTLLLVMAARLNQLFAVRSRLANDIIAFCDVAIAHLDATH